MFRKILVLLIALCSLQMLSGCSGHIPPEEENTVASITTEEEKLAPDYTVTDTLGNEARLSDFRGKPVVLNFWASWCMPCKLELPHFEQAYQKYPQIQFMMVNLLISDEQMDVDAVIADGGYSFPVFYETTGEASYRYNVSSIPMTLFIDAHGRVVGGKTGMLTAKELEAGIHSILS